MSIELADEAVDEQIETETESACAASEGLQWLFGFVQFVMYLSCAQMYLCVYDVVISRLRGHNETTWQLRMTTWHITRKN